MVKNVANLRMTARNAQSRIRKLAENSSNVILGTHAKERMQERDISILDVYRILRNGFVLGEPAKARSGEWQVKVTMRLRGHRDASVITIILERNKLFVKTVFWDDV